MDAKIFKFTAVSFIIVCTLEFLLGMEIDFIDNLVYAFIFYIILIIVQRNVNSLTVKHALIVRINNIASKLNLVMDNPLCDKNKIVDILIDLEIIKYILLGDTTIPHMGDVVTQILEMENTVIDSDLFKSLPDH